MTYSKYNVGKDETFMKKKILKGTLIGIGAVVCFALGWLANNLCIYKAMDDIGDLLDALEDEFEEEDIFEEVEEELYGSAKEQ